jgi:SRSO17 transposase
MPPASGRPISRRWAARDVTTSAEELMAYHQQFATIYQRREQQRWSLFYLCGQLSNLVRKTIEPMVLELYGVDANAVRALQHYIAAGAWAAGSIIRRCQALTAAELGEADGVVIVDGSAFPKQGGDSVGVARQYCGALGKVANCQEGVFAVYATRRGYTFLDERLYVHQSWFGDDHRARWQACGIPDALRFRTEPELALEMVGELVAHAEVPFGWVTADERFGQNPGFLDGVAELGKWYLAEVPADTRVWLKAPPIEPPGCGPLGRPRTRPRIAQSAPPPQAVRDLCASLPATRWTRHTIKEGAKGELVAEFAFVRATTVRAGLPGPCVWVVFRRSLTNPTETKYYHSNAPATCPASELVRVSGLRWPIETALEEAKGELGMDHYETRTWLGWHHHMAHTFMAHGFLTHLRLVFEKTIRLSLPLKPVSWLPKPLLTMLRLSTWSTSLTIASVATTPLTDHTASARWHAIAPGVGA